MKNYYLFILFICLLWPQTSAWAIPAYPHPIEYKQPDGSIITIRLFGDENFHYARTTDGHLLLDGPDGFYKYAQVNESGDLVCSKFNAKRAQDRSQEEKEFLSKTPSDLFFSVDQLDKIKRSELYSTRTISQMISEEDLNLRAGQESSARFLVILVNFTDKQFVTDQSVFDKMLNQPGYSDKNATGSARDYFYDNSFGKFTPQFDVVGPLNLSREMAYYGTQTELSHDSRPREMIVEACQLADKAGVDFKVYDLDGDGVLEHVCVVFAGYNQAQGGPSYTIWPHEWSIDGYDSNFKLDDVRISTYSCSSELQGSSGTNHDQIGTFCHEFCHALGLPDLYDTGSQNAFDPGPYATMASGSYNNGSRTPPFLSSFERQLLGWHTSTRLTKATALTIKHALEDNVSYYYPTLLENGDPNEKELFFIENRQKKGWDKYLPGHGLMILHIDRNDNVLAKWRSNQINTDPNHQCFDIEEADNIKSEATRDMDLYPAGGLKKTFNDLTQPNSKSWSGYSTKAPLKSIEESSDGIITAIFIDTPSAIPSIDNSPVKWSMSNKTLHFEELQPNSQIELYSASGVKLCEQHVTGTNLDLTVAHKGVLILKVTTGGITYSDKIIIH